MVEVSRAWVVSDSIKLAILFGEMVLTVLYLFSPCRDRMRRRLQWMQLAACIVGFVSASCAHGLIFSSWRALVITETHLLILIGLQDIFIANMLNNQKNLIIENKPLESYAVPYIRAAACFVVTQYLGLIVVLLTDRITEISIVTYAGRVLFLVIFDWAMFRRTYAVARFALNVSRTASARSSVNRQMSAAMLDRNSSEDFEEAKSDSESSSIDISQLMSRLKLYVVSSLVGFTLAVSAGSILMYWAIRLHEHKAIFSEEYRDGQTDYNFFQDLGVYLVLTLMLINLFFCRARIDWAAFGCGALPAEDKGAEWKTGQDKSGMLSGA
mmetsp:Transcript_28260/g.45987  ORF Transcript_28260/g.45987 Transcript_28260/m.45987 type:complete len:326 (+) Transcript_28260:100-1077(+)